MSPQFGETAYISVVNRARKVISNAQVATNKNSDPVKIFSLRVAGEDGAQFQLQFSQISEIVLNELS